MPASSKDANDRVEDAMAQISRLRDQVETLIRDKVAPALEDAAEQAEAARAVLRERADELAGAVRHQPLTALLVAIGIGFLLGPREPLSMRSFQLLRIAMEAELLRLKHRARRTGSRVALMAFALILLLGALAFGHIAVWSWLREYMARQYVALIFTGADLLLAAILATLASRSTPGRLEVEALEVRRRALDDAARALSVTAILTRVVDLVLATRRRK